MSPLDSTYSIHYLLCFLNEARMDIKLHGGGYSLPKDIPTYKANSFSPNPLSFPWGNICRKLK